MTGENTQDCQTHYFHRKQNQKKITGIFCFTPQGKVKPNSDAEGRRNKVFRMSEFLSLKQILLAIREKALAVDHWICPYGNSYKQTAT